MAEGAKKDESRKDSVLDILKGIVMMLILLILPAFFFIAMKFAESERDHYKAEYEKLYEENIDLEDQVSYLEDDFEEGYSMGYQDGYSDAQ